MHGKEAWLYTWQMNTAVYTTDEHGCIHGRWVIDDENESKTGKQPNIEMYV